MAIKASEIMVIENPRDYKIHFAVWNGEKQPLDVFVRDRDEWEGWNSYHGHRNDFTRRYIFSLIRFYHRLDKWLFGGIFEIKDRQSDHNVVEVTEQHQEYIGRLLIHYRGPGVRGRAFYLENHYHNLIVSELFEKPYSGEAFCGYEQINHPFSALESIFKQERPDWKAALQNVKGVYLIVDACAGKMYVGSAYGESGIWSRWACYIGTGHGWNDELTRLIGEKGLNYARENFKFSLLEYRAMKTDDKAIIEREQYWKSVLLTGKFGYNKN